MDFLDVAECKAGDNECTAADGRERGDLAQNDEVEDDVEDDGEGTSNLIEGDFDKLETEIVEDDHTGKDEREGEHLFEDVRADFERRDAEDLEGAGDVAEEDSDDALGPGDEKGSRFDVLAS